MVVSYGMLLEIRQTTTDKKLHDEPYKIVVGGVP